MSEAETSVSEWLRAHPGQIYEVHMRAELAKTHGFPLAFSQRYQPRENPSLI